MPKFKKKSIIEAHQFFFVQKEWPTGVLQESILGGTCYVITDHRDQRIFLSDGDWIVKDGDKEGRYYPISAEYMEENYEEIR